VWLSNVSKSRRRATSLPHGPVWGEPSQSEIDHRGAVSRRDSAKIAFVPSHGVVVLTSSQVTVIQADASDDKAISDVCQQALREQGRLDIFFANVSARRSTFPRHAKGFLHPGWSRSPTHARKDIRRDVHRHHANKCSFVSA
jgi:NAD(P)-dependent dehydrogenase (short-subunit alcohol dehydrogenase family)